MVFDPLFLPAIKSRAKQIAHSRAQNRALILTHQLHPPSPQQISSLQYFQLNATKPLRDSAMAIYAQTDPIPDHSGDGRSTEQRKVPGLKRVAMTSSSWVRDGDGWWSASLSSADARVTRARRYAMGDTRPDSQSHSQPSPPPSTPSPAPL